MNINTNHANHKKKRIKWAFLITWWFLLHEDELKPKYYYDHITYTHFISFLFSKLYKVGERLKTDLLFHWKHFITYCRFPDSANKWSWKVKSLISFAVVYVIYQSHLMGNGEIFITCVNSDGTLGHISKTYRKRFLNVHIPNSEIP